MISIPDAQIYLVGGAVRDQLLGLEPGEKDWVVVGSTQHQMLELGYKQVGNDFPVFLHPETREEYALARRERKTNTGHRGFDTETRSISLEEDLERRDLTINSIAKDSQGDLIDPIGGQGDLHNRILRHVSPAFREDPLRVLRVARFNAQLSSFNFSIAPETQNLLKEMSASGELESLTPERVWKETEKALMSDSPRTFFETLRSVGALKTILPEVDALFGVKQRPEFHPEIDAGLHTMLSLDRISEQSPDPVDRFAVLVHDLGKATTPEDILPRHTGHEARGADLVEQLCKRLRIPNQYKNLAVKVTRHHLHCHTCMRSRPEDIVTLLDHLSAWSENSKVDQFTNCCMADARGRSGLETRPYPQREFLAECVEAAADISMESILVAGFKGAEIGARIAELRAQSLQKIIDKYSSIDELKYARGDF